jgi:hypothetical protein
LQKEQISIYLEHDTEDFEFVSSVADSLNSFEIFRVFVSPLGDFEELVPELETEVKKCNLLVIIFTRKGLRSLMIRKEIEIAARENKLVIPFYLGRLGKITRLIPLLSNYQEGSPVKDVPSVVEHILSTASLCEGRFGISRKSAKTVLMRFKDYQNKKGKSETNAHLNRYFQGLVQEILNKLGYVVVEKRHFEKSLQFFDMSIEKNGQKIWVKCIFGVPKIKDVLRAESRQPREGRVWIVCSGTTPKIDSLTRNSGMRLVQADLLINQISDSTSREHFASRLKTPSGKTLLEIKEVEDIMNLLKAPEGQTLEFKSTLRYDVSRKTISAALEKSCLKTVCAFTNAAGGLLVVGVSDDRKILGLSCDYENFKNKNADGFENHVINIIGSRLGNRFLKFINVSFVSIDGKEICKITVSPSDSPVFFRYDDTEEFYVRTGNNSRPFSMGEAIDYIKGHWK